MESSGGVPMISIQGVNKHFGALHVLKDINLDVDRGQVVVVLGPSGSGKSTLCRTINRLETIDSGTIAIDGATLPSEGRKLAQLRSDVGMVFQSFNLFAHKTILDNVTLGPSWTAFFQWHWQFRVVAAGEVERPVRSESDAVGSVLTTSLEFFQQGGFVIVVITVGVLETVKSMLAFAIADHGVEAFVSAKQAVGATDGSRLAFGDDRNWFDGDLSFLRGIDCDAVKNAALVGNDESSLGVRGEGDPGSLLTLGNAVEQLHFETFRDGDLFGGRGHPGDSRSGISSARFAFQNLTPGAHAIFAEHGGFF